MLLFAIWRDIGLQLRARALARSRDYFADISIDVALWFTEERRDSRPRAARRYSPSVFREMPLHLALFHKVFVETYSCIEVHEAFDFGLQV